MKRIILLLDGTWNDSDFSIFDTNIVRIADVISRSLDGGQARGSNYNEEPAPLVRSRGFMGGDVEHLIFYERGVGTTALDQMRGGIFGAGLAANIRRAYRILSFYYEPGDEVFVFGFSRGAYTARSLVGFIGAVAYSKATTVRKNWNARRGNFTEPRQMTVFRVFGQALRRMFTNGRISVSTA